MLYIFVSEHPENLSEYIRVANSRGARSLESVSKLVRNKEPRIYMVDFPLDEMHSLDGDLSAHGYIVRVRPTNENHAEFFLERQRDGV